MLLVSISESLGHLQSGEYPGASVPVPHHPGTGATTAGQYLAQRSMAMLEMAREMEPPYPRLVVDGVGASQRHERSCPMQCKQVTPFNDDLY